MEKFILFFLLSIVNYGLSQNVEWSKPRGVEIPKSKTHLIYGLNDFKSVKFYHKAKNKKVKYINPEVSEITNDSLKNDINLLLKSISKFTLDSHYISGMPSYENAKDIKVLFFTRFIENETVEFEIFLQDNDFTKLTIREYFVLNGANYYVFDENSMNVIKNSLISLIEKYTSYDKSLKLWEDPSKKKEEIIIYELIDN